MWASDVGAMLAQLASSVPYQRHCPHLTLESTLEPLFMDGGSWEAGSEQDGDSFFISPPPVILMASYKLMATGDTKAQGGHRGEPNREQTSTKSQQSPLIPSGQINQLT